MTPSDTHDSVDMSLYTLRARQLYADLPAILTTFSEHAKQNISRGSNSLAWQLMLISLLLFYSIPPPRGRTNKCI
jgi:hypothetical protein